MSKIKKVNISLKRRIFIYYGRFILFCKLAIVVFIYLFFFTNLFGSIKQTIKQNFYNISASQGFILENVIIEGQKNMPPNDIISALNSEKGTAIFAIELDKIRQRLENNAWVKAAIVERRMPRTIYIAIIERTPIAIWQFKQKLYLIDEEGNRISNKDIEKFSSLLHVVGSDANVYVQHLIMDLSRHPDLAKRVTSAVRYGERRWNLNLEQDITVKMPEHNFEQAYNYLNSLNKKEKLFGMNYKTLDLRDPQKYYLE